MLRGVLVKDADRYADFVSNYCFPYAKEFAEEIRNNDPEGNLSDFITLLEGCFGTLGLFFGSSNVSNGTVNVEFLNRGVKVEGLGQVLIINYGSVTDNLILLGRILEALGLIEVSLEFTGAEAQDVRQSDPDVEEDVIVSFNEE